MALRFSCRDAGATCSWQTEGQSQDELLRKIADHVTTKHKVKTVTQTIVNYAVTAVRQSR